jgi:hypothetical protein
MSCGRMELRAAKAWLQGMTTISGSFRNNLNFRPGARFSGRRRGRSFR